MTVEKVYINRTTAGIDFVRKDLPDYTRTYLRAVQLTRRSACCIAPALCVQAPKHLMSSMTDINILRGISKVDFQLNQRKFM